MNNENIRGPFSDYLTTDEVNFSKQAAEILTKNTSWAHKMLHEAKIA